MRTTAMTQSEISARINNAMAAEDYEGALALIDEIDGVEPMTYGIISSLAGCNASIGVTSDTVFRYVKSQDYNRVAEIKAALATQIYAEKGYCFNYLCPEIQMSQISNLEGYIDEISEFYTSNREFLKSACRYDKELKEIDCLFLKLMLMLYDELLGGTIVSSGEIDTGTYDTTAVAYGPMMYSTTRKRTMSYSHSHPASRFLTTMDETVLENRRGGIAQQLAKLDPDYPVKENTWLYHSINVKTLEKYVKPFGLSFNDRTKKISREWKSTLAYIPSTEMIAQMRSIIKLFFGADPLDKAECIRDEHFGSYFKCAIAIIKRIAFLVPGLILIELGNIPSLLIGLVAAFAGLVAPMCFFRQKEEKNRTPMKF